MPSLFRRKNAVRVGVAFGREGLTVARLTPGGRDDPPRLRDCDELAGTPEDIARHLAQWVGRHGAARAPAVGVLAPGDYRVLSIEAPPVPAAELRRAAGWRIRERIDFPVDEAVIEPFEPPAATQRGQRMLHVVVARRATVAGRIAAIERAGLKLDAIDIPELAQREISARLPADGGHALLALDARAGLLTVFRGGEHYLARDLDTGRAALADGAGSASESLVLEVQRSFDYFESALSQAPLASLFLVPADAAIERLRGALAANLAGVECRALALGDVVAVEQPPAHAGATALHALGAALRAAGQAIPSPAVPVDEPVASAGGLA